MMKDDRKVSASAADTHDDAGDGEDDDDDQLLRSKGPLRKRKYMPSPPKRFKSSYICFSIAMQDTVKAELGGSVKISDISKYMAEKWRNLDEAERAKWDEVARKDRERYEEELALFPGPKPRPKQRPKKDPSAPKRPMSSFLAFSQKYRSTVRQNDPTVCQKDVSKRLSEMWKNCPEEEKKGFIEREIKERKVYKAKMAEWKKEQAEVEEKKKEERKEEKKADSKRRKLDKAKEKRRVEKEALKKESVMEKESGDLSAMGFLAAAAAAASTNNDAANASEPTTEHVAGGAGGVTAYSSSQSGHEAGHFGVASAAAPASIATTDHSIGAQAGLAFGSSHGPSSTLVDGYSMEGEVERALASAAATRTTPMSRAQHHPTSPAAALLRAYSQPGGSALSAASVAAAVAQLPSSMSTHVNPSLYPALMQAYAAQDGDRALVAAVPYTGTAAIAPESVSSSIAGREYLQQILAQEDRVREQLARIRAEEVATMAQMRAQFHERARMRLQAERERILLSLQLEGHTGLPGGLTGAHSSLTYPPTAASYPGTYPGLPNRSAYLAQTIHGETVTGNMLLELMEARRRGAALAAATGVAADAGNTAAPQEVSVQPTQPMLPTGAIPLQAPSAALQETSTETTSIQQPLAEETPAASSQREASNQHIL